MPRFIEALGLFFAASALVSASPMPTAAPDLNNAAGLQKRASCTFTGASGAAAAIKSKASCATIVLSALAVPSGTTLDLSGLPAGTHVVFEGETTFGYEEWTGPLIEVGGESIVVTGGTGHVLNGGGDRWWDTFGSKKQGKTKPKFFAAHSLTGTSSITGLNILNTPLHVFSIDSSTGLTISGAIINNAAGDSGGLAHNTDAFDIGSSSNINILNPTVHNQDDCLAVNSGSTIVFRGGKCTNSHGLSIGSVGDRTDNVVSGVTIESSSVTNSANGIRIKTISGATGSVKNVKFSDITLSGISSYGIVIEQDYQDGSPTGTPTTGVPIIGLTINNVTGTVDSTATNIYILCGSGSCSGWTWTGNSVTGGKKSTKCENVPTGVSC